MLYSGCLRKTKLSEVNLLCCIRSWSCALSSEENNAILPSEQACSWASYPFEDCEHRDVIVIILKLCLVHKDIIASLNRSCSIFSTLVLHRIPPSQRCLTLPTSPCRCEMCHISLSISCYSKSCSWCFGLFFKLHFTHQ